MVRKIRCDECMHLNPLGRGYCERCYAELWDCFTVEVDDDEDY